MTRLFFIIILVFFFNPKKPFAQRTANCTISLNSSDIERQTAIYLNNQNKLIQLRFHLENSFTQDSLFLAWEDSYSIGVEERTTSQLVDSVIVNLSNGLSWNIKEGPPQKPSNFVFKLFTKKAKTDQATIDYIRYLEFCSRWTDVKKPCEINDEYSVYTRINIDGTDTFKAKYDIGNKASGEVTLRKLILIDRK